MGCVVRIFLATIGVYFQKQGDFNLFSRFETGLAMEFGEMLTKNPKYAFSLFIDLFSVAMKGVVYFFVLKGISLGLNMIIETDLNYREKQEHGDVQ